MAAELDALTLYDVLEVDHTADRKRITQQHRKQALRWHPDKHHEDDRRTAQKQFLRVQEAYEVLTSEKLRPLYDGYLDARDRGDVGEGTNWSDFRQQMENSTDVYSGENLAEQIVRMRKEREERSAIPTAEDLKLLGYATGGFLLGGFLVYKLFLEEALWLNGVPFFSGFEFAESTLPASFEISHLLAMRRMSAQLACLVRWAQGCDALGNSSKQGSVFGGGSAGAGGTKANAAGGGLSAFACGWNFLTAAAAPPKHAASPAPTHDAAGLLGGGARGATLSTTTGSSGGRTLAGSTSNTYEDRSSSSTSTSSATSSSTTPSSGTTGGFSESSSSSSSSSSRIPRNPALAASVASLGGLLVPEHFAASAWLLLGAAGRNAKPGTLLAELTNPEALQQRLYFPFAGPFQAWLRLQAMLAEKALVKQFSSLDGYLWME
ncbi:unnamed protein product [Amoebophrya sp. A25]|nr:unnamed protein product [Amoebophrya sp. A25]|eukprot:GSA25T00021510001.1